MDNVTYRNNGSSVAAGINSRCRKSKLSLALKYKSLYIMFIPVAIYFILFYYYPILGSVIAFKNFNLTKGTWGSDWAGFVHFERFFTNGDFFRIMRNTLGLNLLRLLFAFPAPIVFAILINEIKGTKFKKVVQTVSYLPHFLSWALVYGIIYIFLSPSIGIINAIIKILGGDSVFFLGEPQYFWTILIISDIWKEIGWGAIIYLAALAGIDEQLYEAAIIDGAGRLRLLLHITLPSIRPIISIMFLLTVGNIMSMGFDQIIVLINAAVREVGETIDYYVYRVGLLQANNYSFSAAVGLFQSLVSLLFVVVSNWAVKKIDEDGGIW